LISPWTCKPTKSVHAPSYARKQHGDVHAPSICLSTKRESNIGCEKTIDKIPGPRDGPNDLDVDAGFKPPILDVGILLVVGLEPLLNVNGGTKVNDVEASMLDV